MEKKNNKKAWLFLLPALIILCVFTFYPFFKTIWLSFINGYDGIIESGMKKQGLNYFERVTEFGVGFQNYKSVLFEPSTRGLFGKALFNTSIIVFVTVPLSTFIALIIAVTLNSIKPLKKFFQTIFFLPYITNSLAIGAVFAVMFQSSGAGSTATSGVMNTIIGWFGVQPIDWLGANNQFYNMLVLVIYIIWSALPFKILILLGALQSVNQQYYDAAKIDGTPRRRIFTRITVPLLSPMISYLLITGFIGAFKEYTSVVGIFGETMKAIGSQDQNMITIVGFIYRYIDGSKAGEYGIASAASLILFAIILFFTVINLYVSKKKVHY